MTNNSCPQGSSKRIFAFVTSFLHSLLWGKPRAAAKTRLDRTKLKQQRTTGSSVRQKIFITDQVSWQ
jgi:hypothetical protein